MAEDEAIRMRLLDVVKAELLARGYRIVITQTAHGIEERVIRPDGVVAVIARKTSDSAPA